ADVAGRAGQDRADRETDRRVPAQEEADQDEEDDARDRDRRVLAVEVSARAFLDRAGDLLHAFVARRLPVDPAGREDPIENRDDGAGERQPQTILLEHEFLPGSERRNNAGTIA